MSCNSTQPSFISRPPSAAATKQFFSNSFVISLVRFGSLWIFCFCVVGASQNASLASAPIFDEDAFNQIMPAPQDFVDDIAARTEGYLNEYYGALVAVTGSVLVIRSFFK